MRTGQTLSNSGNRGGQTHGTLRRLRIRRAAGSPVPAARQTRRTAFTLIEVMIAGGILFVCLFAILALVANSLRNARLIQSMKDDPVASVAAMVSYVYSSTNGAVEPLSGEFMGRSYEAEATFITNGLYLVDIYLPAQREAPESRMQFCIYNGKQIQQGPGMRPAR